MCLILETWRYLKRWPLYWNEAQSDAGSCAVDSHYKTISFLQNTHNRLRILITAIYFCLTHWGRVTHICVGKLTIVGSDNGLLPCQRQAIIWTNAGILLIWPFGTNFSEISIEILTLSFKKMRLKVSSAKWQPFCVGLNVLRKLRKSLHWDKMCYNGFMLLLVSINDLTG